MLVRVVLPIFLLVCVAGAALWFQDEVTRARRHEIDAGLAGPLDLLQLEVGGDLPILAERQREPEPRPEPQESEEPESAPEPRRWTTLGQGETIYGICRRVFGSARRFREILAFNHLTEEGARKLRPGARIYLPPR